MSDINSLPKEVLLRIFEFYLLSESQLDLMSCLSKVCKKWKKACMDSSNFLSVDGSIPTKQLIKLAKAGSLKQTKSLKFDFHKKSKRQNSVFYKNFKNFFTNLPRLRSLDLRNVSWELDRKKEHPIFTELKGCCPNLCELIVGHEEEQCMAQIRYSLFEDFIHVRGPKLVTLIFSFVYIPSIEKVLLLIAENCPNLEELLIQYLVSGVLGSCVFFPVEQVQIGCPKLQVLRLTRPFSFHRRPSPETPGFPELRVFTYSYTDNLYFQDSSFLGLLGNSPNLKVLDIRGVQNVSVAAVHSLPTTDLEQLHISKSGIVEDPEMVILLQKWSHSLKAISMSHITRVFLNEVLGLTFLPHGLPRLEYLDVSNSSTLKTITLRFVLRYSPELTFLDLDMCCLLKAKTRRTYYSRNEIQELRKIEKIDTDTCYYY